MTPTTSALKSSSARRQSWWQRLFGVAEVSEVRTDPRVAPELPTASAELLELASVSLQHCGFDANGFELQLLGLGHAPHGHPILLVQVRKASDLVWDFASHLETYLLDRMYRRGGFRLARILFTPARVAGLELHEARNGVRIAWTSLTDARHGAAADLNLTDRAGLQPVPAFAANDKRA